MNQLYKKAVVEALEAVKGVEDAELRKSGFEIVLRQLLQVKPAQTPSETNTTKISGVHTQVKLVESRANKTGLTQEELGELFEVKEDALILKVKPTGESVAQQQQALARAVLFGYHALLGRDNVSSVAMGTVARGWNLLDTNFSRTIQDPVYIQGRGKRRGVTYSLRPGAIGKLKEYMQKMARGE